MSRSESERIQACGATGAGRRRLGPDQRRRQLLEVGEQLLRARTASDVRVEDLTSAAGVAKGTFYVYFDSWESFLVVLRRRVIQRYREEVAARFRDRQPEADFWGWVAGEVGAALEFHLGLGGLHGALFHGPISDRPVPAEESAPELIRTLIEFGVSIGELACDDPEVAGPLVFDILHAASDQVAGGADRERVLVTVNLLLRRWLGSASLHR